MKKQPIEFFEPRFSEVTKKQSADIKDEAPKKWGEAWRRGELKPTHRIYENC
jgi:hypothetical protein